MVDRLREQIQHGLKQLAGEADRLRKSLAALDPRSSSAPARTAPPRAPARPPAGAGTVEPEAPAATRAATPRPRKTAATSPLRTTPGGTKASVLAALSDGEAMTAGQVAEKTGLGRATISTTLSRLAKSGEVLKADRGYKLASTGKPSAAPSTGPKAADK